mmetsp:Transcript_19599/g.27600  ORF Transcript_19599/g.27600 Transcript_19599/m.27600 type:complete len:201 (+) Transcript_19599:29-631(+)
MGNIYEHVNHAMSAAVHFEHATLSLMMAFKHLHPNGSRRSIGETDTNAHDQPPCAEVCTMMDRVLPKLPLCHCACELNATPMPYALPLQPAFRISCITSLLSTLPVCSAHDNLTKARGVTCHPPWLSILSTTFDGSRSGVTFQWKLDFGWHSIFVWESDVPGIVDAGSVKAYWQGAGFVTNASLRPIPSGHRSCFCTHVS